MLLNVLYGYFGICLMIALWLTAKICLDYRKGKDDHKCSAKNHTLWEYFKFHGAFIIIPLAVPLVNLIFLFIIVKSEVYRFIGAQTAETLKLRQSRIRSTGIVEDSVTMFPCHVCGCRALSVHVTPVVFGNVRTGEKTFSHETTIDCPHCKHHRVYEHRTGVAAIEHNQTYLNSRYTIKDKLRVKFALFAIPRLWESDFEAMPTPKIEFKNGKITHATW